MKLDITALKAGVEIIEQLGIAEDIATSFGDRGMTELDSVIATEVMIAMEPELDAPNPAQDYRNTTAFINWQRSINW